MDVTSLNTNIPQEEGINTVCKTYQEFRQGKSPVPIKFLSLILQENSLQFNGKDYLQTHGTTMATKMAVAFANIFMAKMENRILRHSSKKRYFGKHLLTTFFQCGTQAETK